MSRGSWLMGCPLMIPTSNQLKLSLLQLGLYKGQIESYGVE